MLNYKILSSSYHADLEQKVNEHIEEGYTLRGGLICHYMQQADLTDFIQVVVLKNTEKENG